jgi:hypothetical protein
MPDSFLDDAAAHHRASEVAPEIANHVDVHDNSFVAAVLDPNTKVKLVVETHLDDDTDADVAVVAVCPGHADQALHLPVGDVTGFASLLISSMREAAEVAEEVTRSDNDADVLQLIRERDALARLVLQWQNRRDGDPRPDASELVHPLLVEARRNADNAVALNARILQPLGATGPVGPS